MKTFGQKLERMLKPSQIGRLKEEGGGRGGGLCVRGGCGVEGMSILHSEQKPLQVGAPRACFIARRHRRAWRPLAGSARELALQVIRLCGRVAMKLWSKIPQRHVSRISLIDRLLHKANAIVECGCKTVHFAVLIVPPLFYVTFKRP